MPDLQAGLNVAAASMLNYEAAAVRAAERLARPLVVVGHGAGGLVALMAAARIEPARLVLLDPSPPGEVRGFDDSVALEEGTYDAGERADSLLARAERRRGISVPEVACPVVVVCSGERAEGARVASLYGGDAVRREAASHLDLVLAEGAAGVVSGAGA